MNWFDRWIEDTCAYKDLLHATIRIQGDLQASHQRNEEMVKRLNNQDDQIRVLMDECARLSNENRTLKRKEREHKAKRK
jgi:hypothetical protein